MNVGATLAVARVPIKISGSPALFSPVKKSKTLRTVIVRSVFVIMLSGIHAPYFSYAAV
jgi:hypothetical protein